MFRIFDVSSMYVCGSGVVWSGSGDRTCMGVADYMKFAGKVTQAVPRAQATSDGCVKQADTIGSDLHTIYPSCRYYIIQSVSSRAQLTMPGQTGHRHMHQHPCDTMHGHPPCDMRPWCMREGPRKHCRSDPYAPGSTCGHGMMCACASRHLHLQILVHVCIEFPVFVLQSNLSKAIILRSIRRGACLIVLCVSV